MLQVISTCNYCRGCTKQLGGSGATSGRQGQWFLNLDNAPSHTLLIVQQFLAEKDIPVIIQPPYSPDLAWSDFWLFTSLKMGLKGICFLTMEDIKSSATANSGRFQKKSSAGVSNHDNIKGTRVRARVRVLF
jgi:hypothetical protein